MILLRIAILLAAVGTAAGATSRVGTTRAAPLRVIDVSESMPAVRGARTGEEWIAFADGAKVVVSGEEAASLPRGASRVGLALAAARDVLEARGAPGGPGRDVIVESDGRATDTGALLAARELLRSGHRVYAAPPDPPMADVAIDSAWVLAADAATEGPVSVGTSVAVRLVASVSGRVRVALRRDGRDVDAQEAAVFSGVGARGASAVRGAAVVLRDAEPAARATWYEVRIEPLDGTPDDDRQNDRVDVLATTSEPVIVVLDPAAWPALGAGAASARAPSLASFSSGVSGDSEHATSALSADALVVADVPRDVLTDDVAARVRRAVASGAVLVALGGANSFSAGGWRGTAFERLLPLRSRAPGDGEAAVVVALDRSGSTGESRDGSPPALAVLVRAVAALLAGVPDDVRVAVLPFAERPDDAPVAPGWVRGGDVDRRSSLLDAAARLRAGGGTDLNEAIAAAARAAAASGAKRRRVILLTDGDPDHALSAASFRKARDALATEGVALCAVVSGDARAADALRSLVASPDDVALVGSASAFPESLLAAFRRAESRDEVVRARPRVTVVGEGPEAETLARVEPSALLRLELAPDARLLATADAAGEPSMPFAAVRTLGAGAVVAVAWGPSLEGSAARADDARRSLVPFVRAFASHADRGFVGDVIDDRLVVLAPPGLGALRARRGEGAAPASADRETTLYETQPGRYEGLLPSDRDVDAAVVVTAPPIGSRPVRLPARPVAEHRGAGVNDAFLDALARAGGGRRLAPGESLPVAGERRRVALAPWLALLAVVLFLLDRAVAAKSQRARAIPSSSTVTPLAPLTPPAP